MKKQVLVVIGFIAAVAMFQNCSQARFSDADGSYSTKLAAVESNDENDATDVIVQPENPDDPNRPSVAEEPPTVIPPVVPPPVVPPSGPGNSGNSPGHAANGDDGAGDGNVCILAGPGKSVKLGVTAAGAMQGQHPIPGVLCISADACLNIASQVFDVKGPEFRGYCKAKGNPHVTHLTDEQLKAKVDALLAAPAP